MLHAMLVHAGNELPNEACGLLAGNGDEVCFFYPLTNVASSPTRYTVDPDGHFGALQHAERNGWQLAGVFHRHPDAIAEPSAVDVEAALEPDWSHVILGVDGLRAWTVRGRTVEEQEIRFVS